MSNNTPPKDRVLFDIYKYIKLINDEDFVSLPDIAEHLYPNYPIYLPNKLLSKQTALEFLKLEILKYLD